LPPGNETAAAILNARLLEDDNPHVRLQAMLALADQPSSEAIAKAAVEFLRRPENAADRWLVDATTSAAAANADRVLLAAAAVSSSNPQQNQVADIVANHFARTAATSSVAGILKALPAANPALAGSIINGLQKGWPNTATLKLDDATKQALEKLQPRLALEDQAHLARLAVRLGSTQLGALADSLAKTLLDQVEDSKLALRDRAHAAELAVSVKPSDAKLAGQVLDLITPQSSPEFNLSLLRALQASAAPGLGAQVLNLTATLAPATREVAIDLLLSRAALTGALLDALDAGALRTIDLSLMQRQRLERHPDKTIRTRAKELLAKNGAVPSANRQQVLAEYAAVAQSHGDAAHGKAVFTKTCAVCHRYRGEGASLGPDLTGMAVHGKEHLLQNIIDPNRDVEANFQAYVVQTADGQVITGMLVSESATEIEIVDAQSKRHAILREDIEELNRSGVSFMPEGFEKQLSRGDLADVLEFLGQRSRFVPLDLRRVGTVSSARGMFNSSDAKHERMLLDDWNVKQVEGVPFYPIDPQGGRVANVILLYSPRGAIPPTMPRSVTLDYGAPAKAIHLLGGVAGWGFPATNAGTTSMIVRLHYADGQTEDHPLKNGVHVADYLGHQNVDKSKPALDVGQQQLRYLKLEPKRSDPISSIELLKGDDETAPLVMAITAEQP
jgi:putative heme-binding domain-containing protein